MSKQEEYAMPKEQALKWKERRQMGHGRFIGLYGFFFLGGPVFSYKLWRYSQGSGSFLNDVVLWPAMAVIAGGCFGHWLWRFNEAAFAATPVEAYKDDAGS